MSTGRGVFSVPHSSFESVRERPHHVGDVWFYRRTPGFRVGFRRICRKQTFRVCSRQGELKLQPEPNPLWRNLQPHTLVDGTISALRGGPCSLSRAQVEPLWRVSSRHQEV